MQSSNHITVQTTVNAPIERVWDFWVSPGRIQEWNHASPDWHCPSATNDLRVGGEFHYVMAAKDGSIDFDFNGMYTEVTTLSRIAYSIQDGRTVVVTFEPTDEGVVVTETFEMEHENSAEMQKGGWQAILENFKRCVEAESNEA